MEKTEKNGIVEGVIWRQLLAFFFPILLGTLFQQLYNTVDAVVVGRFAGKAALAAVGGSAAQILNLLISFFVGLSSGATVAEGLAVTYMADGSYAWTGTALGGLTAGDHAEKWGTTTITGLPKYAADGTTEIEYYVLETATSEQEVNIETTYRVSSGAAGANTDATVTDDTDPIVIVNQDVDASTSIRIIKVDAQNHETRLSDAAFSLKRVKDADGTDVEEEADTQTTNSDGEATFGNLQGGTYELTETQSPAGYETSFESVTFTVARQGNTLVVTYTDGTDGVVTYDSASQEFTVTNDAIVDIDATKRWKQSDGETDLNETLANAEVTFTLWRKVGEGEWAQASDIDDWQVTLKVEGAANAEAWKTSWTGLPKYDGDALIAYKVVESDAKVGGAAIDLPETPEAEAANYGTVEGHTNPTAEVGLTNTLPPTTVEGSKIWEIEGDVPADPTLKLTRLSAKEGAAEEVVKDADNTADLQPTWSGEGNERSYSYADLPKYDGEGYEYTYTVTEAGFTLNDVDYTVSTEDGETFTVTPDDGRVRVSQNGNDITNTELTTVEATKEWANLPENDETEKSATLTLKRYKGKTLDAEFGEGGAMTGVLDGTLEEAGATSGELTAWHYTWAGLEKAYLDEATGEYKAYTYKVVESEFTYGEGTYTVTESDGEYTVQLSGTATAMWIVKQGEDNDITNTKNDTFIHIAKVWKENGEVVDGPDDASIKSINVTLYRVNGSATEIGTYTLTVDPGDTNETHIQPDEAGKWKWTIDDLEKYHIESDDTLTEYQYYIKETKVGGYTILSYTNGTDTLDDEEELATASEGGASTVRVTEDGTITVTNSKWTVSLPSTGGAGTTPFYATGVSLLLLAAIWFVWAQRKRAKMD